MAIKVPIYTPQTDGAGSLPGYRQNVQAHSPLTGLGQDVARLGAGVGDLQRQLRRERDLARREQDEAVQLDAWRRLVEAKQSLLQDPVNGLVAKRGQAALAERDSFLSYFEATAKQIREGLADERQRIAFDRIAHKEVIEFRSTVDTHVFRESQQVAKQARDGAISTAVSEAVHAASAGDFGKVRESITLAKATVALQAESEGWDSDATEKAQRVVATKAHLDIIKGMLDAGRAVEARDYLNEVRSKLPDELDGSALTESKLEPAIEAGARSVEGMNLAQDIVRRADGDPVEAEKLLVAADIKDPLLLREVRQHKKNLIDGLRQAIEQRDKQGIGRLEQRLYAGGFGSLSQLQSTSDYVALSDAAKGDAVRMWRAEMRSRRSASREERSAQSQFDRNAEADFRNLAANFPEEAAEVDLRRRYPDASKRGLDLIGERQGKLRATLEKSKSVGRVDFVTMIRDAAAKAGLRGIRGRSVVPGSQAESVIGEMTNWYMDFFQENGRLPRPKEVKEAMYEAVLYGEEADGGMWNANMRAAEARRRGIEHSTAGFEKENEELRRLLGVDEQEEDTAAPAPASSRSQSAAAKPSNGPVIRRVDPATGEARVWDAAARQWVKE